MMQSFYRIAALLTRIVLLFLVATCTTWFFATPSQRSQYLGWVPLLFNSVTPGDLTKDLAYKEAPAGNTTPSADANPSGLLSRLRTFDLGKNTKRGVNNSACQELEGSNVQTEQKQVYQWKDATGKLHITDTPPVGRGSQLVNNRTLSSKRYFTITIDDSNATLPAFARDRFHAELEQIYYVLKQGIGIAELRHVKLNIRLFDRRQDYEAYQQKVAPELGQSSGFYNPRQQEAAIYTANYDQQTFGITRHEATHAILSGLYGILPVWFNEGLAEYFGSMVLNGQSKEMPIHSHHLKLITENKDAIPPLTGFLTDSQDGWYHGKNKGLRYAISWSLVFFLLDNQARRTFTRDMMDHWGEEFCTPFDTVRRFENYYPRGLNNFEKEWRSWLTSEPDTPHRY